MYKRQQDDRLGPLVDPTRIGAFGFSQGGLTILRTLGAEANQQALLDHCDQNGADDPEFCFAASESTLTRLGVLWNKATYTPPPFDPGQPVQDTRIKTAVIAAPVGAPITDLANVQRPLWLIRAGDNDQVNFPFHAEAVHQSLPQSHDYTILDGVGHYAFLSPFPESLKAEVGAPAEDPEGFDRAAFLEGLNQDIVAYFQRQLGSL